MAPSSVFTLQKRGLIIEMFVVRVKEPSSVSVKTVFSIIICFTLATTCSEKDTKN